VAFVVLLNMHVLFDHSAINLKSLHLFVVTFATACPPLLINLVSKALNHELFNFLVNPWGFLFSFGYGCPTCGSFSGRSKPTPPLPASRQSYKTSGITCQWCNKDQHTTKKCHKLGKVLKKAKAGGLIEAFASTSLKDSSDTGWCTDTGATSHMTNDTAVLDEFSPYNGNQRVFMGNGQPLSIPRTGSTSSLIASKSLKIYDALLVPCINKKLFSTSKLTGENNCIMFWFYHTGSIWQQEWWWESGTVRKGSILLTVATQVSCQVFL
jgi:hypothetical protein